MGLVRRSAWVVFVGVLGLVASPGYAQVLGPFTMQLAPFCNVITFTVAAQGPIFSVAGFDDNCGGATRLSAAGSLFSNPNGTVGGGLSIIAAGQAASPVALTINPAGPSGTWTDSSGNSGTLVFGVSVGSGSPRPAPPAVSPALFANVKQDGSLLSGTALAAVRRGTGDYRVTFGQDVRNCAAVATSGPSPGFELAVLSVFGFTQVGVSLSPNEVEVRLFESTGSINVDTSFHLIVSC